MADRIGDEVTIVSLAGRSLASVHANATTTMSELLRLAAEAADVPTHRVQLALHKQLLPSSCVAPNLLEQSLGEALGDAALEGPVQLTLIVRPPSLFLSASEDGHVKLWDFKSEHGEMELRPSDCIRTLAHGPVPEGCRFSAALSPDGTMILTGCANTVTLWGADSSDRLRVFTAEKGVESVAFFPGGALLLLAVGDAAVVWVAQSGECVHSFEGHGGSVLSAVASKDGTRVLTASWDNTAKLWDASSAECLQTFTGHTRVVRTAAFSSDGTRVLTASSDKTARIFSAATGETLQLLIGHIKFVQAGSFSSDGAMVVTAGSDSAAKLWLTQTGELRHSLAHAGPVLCACFSTDGARVVTAGADRQVKLWDTGTGDCVSVIHGHEAKITAISFF